MTDKQFSALWDAALTAEDRAKFVSSYAASPILLENPSEELGADLAIIWDVAHMSFKELRAYTGLSQVAFSVRYCIPRRTVENWDAGTCPDYVRLMLAQLLGIIKR